ncbi:UNVERIFIED_CONTAM: hypothetical protein FKN15_010272 [Acipenser sinensis]
MRSPPPPQPQPPPLRYSPALLRVVPCPLLLDTLPVCLDLHALDLEPRSLHHRPQLCPWFPTPLSPSTQTLLGCCQMSLVLPLFAASLCLCDRTSLRRSPGEDLCPLLHPPVNRHLFSHPCHPGGVLCRRFVVPLWKCRRDRPTLKVVRGRGQRLKKSDLRVGGLLRVVGSGLGMADRCCTLEGKDV